MQKIPLTKNKFAIVDDKDYAYLKCYKWTYHNAGYAFRLINNLKGGRKPLYMHREIMDAPIRLQVDHISGDGLDNRHSNLRLCTAKGNARNSKRHKSNTSGYKGVVYNKRDKGWLSQIIVNGKKYYGGLFGSKVAAAKSYDLLASKHFGEFANLNFKKDGYVRSA